MRRVGAHDEGGLEEVFAHLLGAAAIVLEIEIAAALASGRLLVPEAEAQELRGIVREERLHRPLRARRGRILCPIVAKAQHPFRQLSVIEGLEPGVDIEPLAVTLARLVYPLRIRDDEIAEGEEVFAEKGEGSIF